MADADRGGQPGKAGPARVIVAGSAALTEGFGLIGVETLPDATAEQLEVLLGELWRGNEKALVFIEHGLAREAGTWLQRVRDDSGRIVVTEVPPLHTPGDYHPLVEDVVKAVLGPSALDDE
jgi:vacuolar-type H+-ATPase subunit F/Vma7